MTQTLHSRKSWGARYQDGTGPRPLPIEEWWLHHAAGDYAGAGATFDQDAAGVRRLESIGESRFGTGISYTFPVARSGRIFVGHSMPRIGSHTKGHNTIGAAFCLMQNCADTPVTAAQRLAIAQRMVIERRAGRANRHTLNGGHQQASGNSTDCPERYGMAAVDPINDLARELWASGYPATGDDMPTADEIAQAVWAHQLPRPGNDTPASAGSQLGAANVNSYRANNAAAAGVAVWRNFTTDAGDLDVAVLAAALGPQLAPYMPAAGSVSQEQLEAALRSVLGSVDGAVPPAAP